MLTNVLVSMDINLLASVDSYVSKKQAAAHAHYKARLAVYNKAIEEFVNYQNGTKITKQIYIEKHGAPPPKPTLPKKENINRSTVVRSALQAYITK